MKVGEGARPVVAESVVVEEAFDTFDTDEMVATVKEGTGTTTRSVLVKKIFHAN